MAAKMRTMVNDLGMMQHEVAAHFHVNQGRVSEVVNGLRFRDVPPAPLDSL
jgi:predicted XRE-type DNA-binding protein